MFYDQCADERSLTRGNDIPLHVYWPYLTELASLIWPLFVKMFHSMLKIFEQWQRFSYKLIVENNGGLTSN